MNVAEIQNLLRELGLSPSKALGQNFLINQNTIQKIIESAAGFNSKQIIEVGPGLGALTRKLVEINQNLKLIELDRGLSKYWRDQGFDVTEKDAIQHDWDLFLNKQNSILVSNLPYQISASIVVDRSLDSEMLSGMILMFQKEVAQKIKARVGDEDYGFLSVISQLAWNIEKLVDAKANDFWPPPKIASRVLIFRSKKIEPDLRSRIFKLTKAGFKQPRKYLLSNLEKGLHLPKELLQDIFLNQKIDFKERAEKLSLEDWVSLEFEIQKNASPQ